MNSVQACNSERPSNGKLPNALEVRHFYMHAIF